LRARFVRVEFIPNMEVHRLTIHAAYPTSLASATVADVVRASALETAEHHGVAAPEVQMFADRIELAAPLSPTILLALATMIRRTTGRWHLAKYGTPLWQGE
jgi:hypothetical protein